MLPYTGTGLYGVVLCIVVVCFSLRKCMQVCFGNSSLNEVLYRRFIVFCVYINVVHNTSHQ